ncbi:MAG TPA: hypothetical protein VJN65_06885 [Bacteroidota bacterium]|nr:hypothetical protein [Bacteroidota bacterium]
MASEVVDKNSLKNGNGISEEMQGGEIGVEREGKRGSDGQKDATNDEQECWNAGLME